MTETDVLVVGGGFYGCSIAAHLAERGRRVVLAEKHDALMRRASYVNQARVHQGYHYPRSLLTGLRSRANYGRFVHDFAVCVRPFDAYYAVARDHSKVSASQFALFCRRIGAPLAPAPPAVTRLFEPALIEAVYRVEEAAFDAVALAELAARRLADAGVAVRTGVAVRRVRPLPGGRLVVEADAPTGPLSWRVGEVFNCTYSQLNTLLSASGLPPVPLKHELAEMALVRMPEPLRGAGFTVMCGPFFSVMPFPPAGLHTLSHVRYTPHGAWSEPRPAGPDPHAVLDAAPRASHFERMCRDARRYLPALSECEYVRSLWEVKTVLPVNEQDDGRPILFLPHAGVPNLHCVLGAKIDNVADVLDRIDETLPRQPRVA
jgi:glycine/D-amino acid oxidase-like deaminating enzyme